MPDLKKTNVMKLQITLLDMCYFSKLENLSDVNHIAILFLPNPLKHTLKKKEKTCNGLKYKGNAMKAGRGSGGMFPVILNLGTRWRLVSITQA
jgi:hypothetical protein